MCGGCDFGSIWIYLLVIKSYLSIIINLNNFSIWKPISFRTFEIETVKDKWVLSEFFTHSQSIWKIDYSPANSLRHSLFLRDWRHLSLIDLEVKKITINLQNYDSNYLHRITMFKKNERLFYFQTYLW